MTANKLWLEKLGEIGPQVERLRKRKFAELCYNEFAGAIFWDDEVPFGELSLEAQNGLTSALGYRTSLAIGKPEAEFLPYWEVAKITFPDWIGFLPERTNPDSEILELFKKTIDKWDSELRELEAEIEEKEKFETDLKILEKELEQLDGESKRGQRLS